MKTSDSIKSLVSALAKAQSEFPVIPKSKTVSVTSKRTGAKYTFDYAPLEVILHSIRPVLKNNGLAFIQSVSGDALTTMLLHSSGEWIESDPLPIRAMEDGPQALGSAITYGRRYGLTSMLGIVTEDDDDGNAAEGNSATKSERGSGPKITPTSGIWESLSADKQTWLEDIAGRVAVLLRRNDDTGAWMELTEHDNQMTEDEKAGLWSRFDSTQRSRLKKACDKINKEKEAA